MHTLLMRILCFKSLLSNVKQLGGWLIMKKNFFEGFKPPMSKVKLDKYTLYISSKSKKVNKKAPKKPKSPSMSKFKSVKTG